MSSLTQITSSSHEQVSIFTDASLGITAIIAVHSTVLGPSLGGCRIRDYPSLDDALTDALRLAEGMTYKNSLAGLHIGGGKSVIIAGRDRFDPVKDPQNRRALFLRFGEWVQSMGGRYISAEDMGTSVSDVETMSERTPFVTGRDPSGGQSGGNPSPYTARGVFGGITACLERRFGNADFAARRIAVQGVGAVGLRLVKLLTEAGAQVTVADTNVAQVNAAREQFGASIADLDQLYQTDCDVFSPCAIGATINARTIPRLRCSIIAGAANNQLETAGDELELRARGIIYAPDFAINAGGVIMCADEIETGGYTQSRVDERVARIGQTVGKILDEAQQTGGLAGAIAVQHAQGRIESVRIEKARIEAERSAPA